MVSKASTSAAVSRGGGLAVAQRGRHVATIDRGGAVRRWRLPEDAIELVCSPDGQLFLATALSGVYTLDADGDVVGEAATDGPVTCVASSDHGFVVAVDRHDVEGPSMYAWRGSPLVPLGEPAPLGEVVVEGVDVHGDGATALLWGVFGSGGSGTAGDRFVSLITVGDDAEVVWSGAGLPIEPTRWWLTATGGIVAHDRHRIVRIGAEAIGRDVADAPVVAVDELATSNVSPDGRYVAWTNRLGPTLAVQSVALSDGRLRTHGDLPGDVSDEVIAVSDDGVVTVAAAIDRETVGVWRSTEGEMGQIGELRAKV